MRKQVLISGQASVPHILDEKTGIYNCLGLNYILEFIFLVGKQILVIDQALSKYPASYFK